MSLHRVYLNLYRLLRSVVSLAALSVACSAVLAADAPAPSGVVAITSTASVDVTRDTMEVTLSTMREGTDANAVQVALKQALDKALADAKSAVKPGQLDVRTGNFSLNPRYDKNGKVSGWQGTAELVIDGRDLPAISQLAGRIQSMTIARVSQGLSREKRESTEEGVTAQAIGRYRARAAEVAKHFGYAGYQIREVNVASNDQTIEPMPAAMYRGKMAMASDEPLPVAAGVTSVSVTVSGTVQLLK
jgi:predicted secreted protein